MRPQSSQACCALIVCLRKCVGRPHLLARSIRGVGVSVVVGTVKNGCPRMVREDVPRGPIRALIFVRHCESGSSWRGLLRRMACRSGPGVPSPHLSHCWSGRGRTCAYSINSRALCHLSYRPSRESVRSCATAFALVRPGLGIQGYVASLRPRHAGENERGAHRDDVRPQKHESPEPVRLRGGGRIQ